MKWEELGGGGNSKEEEGGEGLIARRKSSDFIQRLSVFEGAHEADIPTNIPTLSFNSTHISKSSEWNTNDCKSDNINILSYRMRGGPLLAETRTNGKRGQDDGDWIACETKKQHPNYKTLMGYIKGIMCLIQYVINYCNNIIHK